MPDALWDLRKSCSKREFSTKAPRASEPPAPSHVAANAHTIPPGRPAMLLGMAEWPPMPHRSLDFFFVLLPTSNLGTGWTRSETPQ